MVIRQVVVVVVVVGGDGDDGGSGWAGCCCVSFVGIVVVGAVDWRCWLVLALMVVILVVVCGLLFVAVALVAGDASCLVVVVAVASVGGGVCCRQLLEPNVVVAAERGRFRHVNLRVMPEPSHPLTRSLCLVLSCLVCVRYHFAASEGAFFQRPPYRNYGGCTHTTRCGAASCLALLSFFLFFFC